MLPRQVVLLGRVASGIRVSEEYVRDEELIRENRPSERSEKRFGNARLVAMEDDTRRSRCRTCPKIIHTVNGQRSKLK
jgi:hypothetical protein